MLIFFLFLFSFIFFFFFFFNDTATTEIYTLSLHDALPISNSSSLFNMDLDVYDIQNNIKIGDSNAMIQLTSGDRKSTRLNSSHSQISYAVFCLKKKKKE